MACSKNVDVATNAGGGAAAPVNQALLLPTVRASPGGSGQQYALGYAYMLIDLSDKLMLLSHPWQVKHPIGRTMMRRGSCEEPEHRRRTARPAVAISSTDPVRGDGSALGSSAGSLRRGPRPWYDRCGNSISRPSNAAWKLHQRTGIPRGEGLSSASGSVMNGAGQTGAGPEKCNWPPMRDRTGWRMTSRQVPARRPGGAAWLDTISISQTDRHPCRQRFSSAHCRRR